VGVALPDIAATHKRSDAQFAIEAKTGHPVLLEERDLDGIRMREGLGVVASFILPDTRPRWCLTDLSYLSAGRWQWWQLQQWPAVDFGYDLQDAFLTLVARVPVASLVVRSALVEWASHQRDKGWDLSR
jgi:hypothetical protein